MKKRKLKKKPVIITITSIAILVMITTILIPFIKEEYQTLLSKKIKDNYQNTMQVTEDTKILKEENEEMKQIGTIYKDTIIELESIKDNYYKIKGTNYYIEYNKLKSTEQNMEQEANNHLLFNENAILKAQTPLYKNGTKTVTLNQELILPILEKGEEFYKLKKDNTIVEVKKEDIKEITKSQNNNQEILESISILSFESENNIESKLDFLKEKKYSYITEKELIQFLNKDIVLPKNTTMIIFREKNDATKNLEQAYNLTLNYESNLTKTYQEADSQVTTLSNLTKYKVLETTTEARFQDMLKGVKEIKDKATSIAVLNYHFFYDEEKEVCSESICSKTKDFEEQLKYLKDNNFKTLTMQEFYDWHIGKIELPKKSVLITVDDGAFGTDTHLPRLLEEYDAKATLFLISGWWSVSKYTLGNLELQSHTHDLHHNNFVRDGKKGIKTLMLTKDEIKTDLQLSKQTLNNPIAFCYPFYAYNDTLVSAVKEEFKIAFAGGNKKATRQSDIYKIPRYPIYKTTSLAAFKNIVN